MKRTPVTSWGAYAIVGLIATVLVAIGASTVLASGASRAVWVGAGIAYVLQLTAFGLLLALRGQPQLFMIAWLSGMMLRFGVLGLCAWWLSETAALPRSTTLISYVGFVFMLLLLEPLFLRWDQRGS